MATIKYTYSHHLKEKSRKLRKESTIAEAILWNQLKNKQIKKYLFNRQKPIDNYIVDFYCHRLKLIIEIDGSSHRDKIEYDKKREEKLKKLGLYILKFKDSDIKSSLDAVMERINDYIDKIKN